MTKKSKPNLVGLASVFPSEEEKIDTLREGFRKYHELLKAKRCSWASFKIGDNTALIVDEEEREKILNQNIELYQKDLIKILQGLISFVNAVAEATTK